jgi:hypothetical protein
MRHSDKKQNMKQRLQAHEQGEAMARLKLRWSQEFCMACIVCQPMHKVKLIVWQPNDSRC